MITLSQFEEMLKREWCRYFPERYQHGGVVFYEQALRNGGSITQVCIRGVSDKAPLLPVKPYYDAIAQGAFAGNILKTMADDYQRGEEQRAALFDQIVAMQPQHFENMKSCITFALVNRDASYHLLQDAVYLPFEDLAKVFYLQVNSKLHAQVTKEMCSEWGVTAKDLDDAALENMPRLFPARLSNINEIVFGGKVQNCLKKPGDLTGNLYALTNEQGVLGAAVMLYSDLMKEITERIKTPFYIIPSSVHEVLILPQKEGMSLSGVKEIVRTVNRKVIEPEDFLSNNVYGYDVKTKEIRMMYEDIENDKDRPRPKKREHAHER